MIWSFKEMPLDLRVLNVFKNKIIFWKFTFFSVKSTTPNIWANLKVSKFIVKIIWYGLCPYCLFTYVFQRIIANISPVLNFKMLILTLGFKDYYLCFQGCFNCILWFNKISPQNWKILLLLLSASVIECNRKKIIDFIFLKW